MRDLRTRWPTGQCPRHNDQALAEALAAGCRLATARADPPKWWRERPAVVPRAITSRLLRAWRRHCHGSCGRAKMVALAVMGATLFSREAMLDRGAASRPWSPVAP